jgi:Zn-dependent peptidase ImmA (M78 family)
MEYEANQFATELLMPEETVRGIFARAMLRMNDDDLVVYLAREMLVSLEAMRWRLRNLGLLPLPGRNTRREGVR